MKRVLLIASIVLAAASTAFAASAVPGSKEANGKPEINYFGDWAVRCFPIKSPSPCDMLFATIRKNTTQRVTSVSIAYVPSKGTYLMQVAVPLGIDLGQGVVIQAGSYSTEKLTVRRCDQSGCFVETGVGNDLIDGLTQNADQGGQLKVVASGGKPVSLAMSLKGFSAAHQAMVDGARQKAATP